jgi:hypothetical protein
MQSRTYDLRRAMTLQLRLSNLQFAQGLDSETLQRTFRRRQAKQALLALRLRRGLFLTFFILGTLVDTVVASLLDSNRGSKQS